MVFGKIDLKFPSAPFSRSTPMVKFVQEEPKKFGHQHKQFMFAEI